MSEPQPGTPQPGKPPDTTRAVDATLIHAARQQAKRAAPTAKLSAADFVQAVLLCGAVPTGQQDRIKGACGKLKSARSCAAALVRLRLLTNWQARQLLAGQSNLRLHKYVLRDELGRGGMGCVLDGWDAGLRRHVAIKVMSSRFVADPAATARFEREMQLLAAVQHPNIVAAIDAGHLRGRHYLVMEYVPGHTVAHYIQQSAALDIAWCCDCISQALAGLQCVYEAGLVHRDIKPSNLIVRAADDQSSFTLKILDLGLGRFVNAADDSTLTGSDQIMGTPDYMSPEQAENVRQVDIRSDIYSLGCTLFAMLAGRPPFHGSGHLAKLLARCRHDAPPIREFRADVPIKLQTALATMLARSPDDRFASPRDAAAAIAPFAHGADFESTHANLLASLGQPLDGDTEAKTDNELQQFLASLADCRAESPSPAVVHASPASAASSLPATEDGPLPISTPTLRPVWILVGIALLIVTSAAALSVFLFRQAPGDLTTQREPRSTGNSEDADDFPPQLEDDRPKEALDKQAPLELKPLVEIPAAPVVQQPKANSIETGSPNDKPATTPIEKKVEPQPVVPRTRYVGRESGQYPSLEKALGDCGPGDTIVVLKRLAYLPPMDLTGKTPLTIRGGKSGDGQWWPVICQSRASSNELSQAWISGDQLDLHLERLQLAIGGPDRQPIQAGICLQAGRVAFTDCSITVGCASLLAVGDPVPLVRCTHGAAEVSLQRTFIRGAGVNCLLDHNGGGACTVEGDNAIWAGRSGPWVRLACDAKQVRIRVRQSTLYNLENLLLWEPVDDPASSILSLSLERSLLVGAAANRHMLIESNWKGWRLSQAVEQQRVVLHASGNAFHSFSAGLAAGESHRKGISLAQWNALFDGGQRIADVNADPIFRVWPSGYELDGTQMRDLLPRFEEAGRRRQDRPKQAVGAQLADMPPDNWIDYSQPVDPTELRRPYRRTRILEVNQRRGPYTRLADAFHEARDGDIIEITDSGVYVPVGDFDRHSSHSVLWSAANRLTVRAADGSQPVVLLDSTLQRRVPQPEYFNLMELAYGYELTLEGLTLAYRHKATANSKLLVLSSIGRFVKIVGCTFVDGHDGSSSGRYAQLSTHKFAWLENSVFLSKVRRDMHSGNDLLLARNCLLAGGSISWGGGAAYGRPVKVGQVRLEHCTAVPHSLVKLSMGNQAHCDMFWTDCLMLGPTPLTTYDLGTLGRIRYRGRHNLFSSAGPLAVAWDSKTPLAGNLSQWQTRWALDAATDRVKRTRTFGDAKSSEPYRKFQPRGGQPASTHATDGGVVGVRVEYLPKPAASIRP